MGKLKGLWNKNVRKKFFEKMVIKSNQTSSNKIPFFGKFVKWKEGHSTSMNVEFYWMVSSSRTQKDLSWNK
jgi:hypothetical protein